MENKEFKALELALLERVEPVIDELRSFLDKSALKGSVGGGVGIGYQHVNALVMYGPHNDPKEESIDIYFEVDLSKVEVKEAKIDILLMWSYGSLLKPYIEDEILTYSSLDELAIQLGQLFDSLEECFLKDMKKEMQIERAPVYRDRRL